MTDSGGRVKPLPIQNPAYLSDITEVGHYYIYTQDTQNALDFRYRKRLEMQVGSLMYCLDTIMVL